MRTALNVAIAASVFIAQPAFASETAAQSTVRVGDGTLDGSFLQPYNNAWFYTAKSADGQLHPQGIWTDHLQWAAVNGRQALMRLQGITFLNGLSNSTINVFDPKTMAPIRTEKHNLDGTVFKRTFDGAHITSATLRGPKDVGLPKATELPQAVYDFNGGLYGLLLAALPMKAGFSGSLPAVADTEDILSIESFRVLRQEQVSAGARGRVNAWVVESDKPKSYTMTFWITKAPPYIIRLVMDDRANARVLTWDMI